MRALLAAALLTSACAAPAPQYDVVIRHGTVYDGSGSPRVAEDVAIAGDRIAARGTLGGARGRDEVDASGLAVAPGFIDMLNHSETSLIADGRSQSGIRQGVTLSVFGESSMGPLSEAMKQDQMARQGDIKFPITWIISWRAGFRPTSRRLSAPRPFARTKSVSTTARRHRWSSTGCGTTSASRWTRARWG